MTEMRPIWVRREAYLWDLYDWDVGTRVCSDMTERSSLPLTMIIQIYLDPNFHGYDCGPSRTYLCKFGPKLFGSSLDRQGVSVISVSRVDLASSSKFWSNFCTRPNINIIHLYISVNLIVLKRSVVYNGSYLFRYIRWVNLSRIINNSFFRTCSNQAWHKTENAVIAKGAESSKLP